MRRIVVDGALEAHLLDHLATAQERRHRLEVFAPRPQRAGTGRAAQLVPGEGVEIAADRGHVDRPMRHRLGAIDQGDDAAAARFAADIAHRIDRAQHVGGVGEGEKLHRAGELLVQHLRVQRPVGQQLDHLDARAAARGHQLPGHDVGVVLHAGEENHVTRLEPRLCPGIRDQIDREGGAAGQHDFVATRIDEARQLRARAFVGLGGLVAELVHGAADVGVVAAVEIVHRRDHRIGLLAGVGRIEIDQRLAVDLARKQREARAQCRPVGFVRAHARVSRRPSSAASAVLRKGAPRTLSTSRQKAAVSMRCACACGIPRERR